VDGVEVMKSVAVGLVVVESVVDKVTRRYERVVVKSFAVGLEAVDTAYVMIFSILDTKHQGLKVFVPIQ